MKKLVVILMCLFLLTGCASNKDVSSNEESSMDTLNKDIVDSLVKDGAILIDVRTREEYNERHIDGAINIPYDEIDESFPYDKDVKIILYCRSGARAGVALETLQNMGYTSLYNLGSIDNYK